MVANKADLESRQQVYSGDGQAFAQQIGFEFFEASAMQSRNIEEPFKALASMFFDKYQEKVDMLSHM